ncbi:hypothetical protein CMI48_04425 [Candidatus Pacearchaeota archaeon]|jgi:hypothetical protein|nr:hypothetical protein [Candidatus Pacearchaeota archaeon]|tara:strand:+ start:307 stop:687 length:381 start_codon:yes stop_codon:yes gene_type:complete
MQKSYTLVDLFNDYTFEGEGEKLDIHYDSESRGVVGTHTEGGKTRALAGKLFPPAESRLLKIYLIRIEGEGVHIENRSYQFGRVGGTNISVMGIDRGEKNKHLTPKSRGIHRPEDLVQADLVDLSQ